MQRPRSQRLLASHGLEDSVTAVDGRPALFDELRTAAAELRAHVARQIWSLIRIPEFLDAPSGSSSRRLCKPVSPVHRDRSVGTADAVSVFAHAQVPLPPALPTAAWINPPKETTSPENHTSCSLISVTRAFQNA